MLREDIPGYRSARVQYHRLRRAGLEAIGDYRYSRPALFDMDRKLEAYLPSVPGTFLEAGGFNGFHQSNTYYLERAKGWTGILVEPVGELARQCQRVRRRSTVEQVALVADSQAMPEVRMAAEGPVSRVIAEPADSVHEITVPTSTLTEVLVKHNAPRPDFMSLDMEGAEFEALEGLDLERFGPEFLLIEMLGLDEVRERDQGRERFDERLGATHEFVAMLSHHDVLYRRRS